MSSMSSMGSMPSIRTVVITAAAAFLLTGASQAAEPAQRTATDFRWSGHVAPGKTLEIKGINGDVTAVAGGADAEVVAVREARRSDPDSVRIEVVEHADGVTICAVYPSREGDEPNECQPGDRGRMNTRNNDTNVRFTVHVPAGVAFTGRTVNGNVEATNLGGDLRLRTVNGSVEFSTTGRGEATTVNGSIRGSLGRADWTDALSFKTVNGEITLDLPGTLSTEVSAKTVNGSISTEFPMTIQGTFSRRRLSGTIGGGGRQLDLESVNGSITLRKR